MIRQPVVAPGKIEALVLDSAPEIPVPGNQEAMGVTEVVVDGTAVAELRSIVEKIAIRSVGRFIFENLVRILIRRRGGFPLGGNHLASTREICRSQKRNQK